MNCESSCGKPQLLFCVQRTSGDVAQNIADVLTPVDTLTAFNNFEGTSLASIDMNNVMGSGIVNFNDLFIYSISD
ncbi:MAG: hypothetical protein K6A76_06605, partial [Oribacterium sp.]|nr:hypothetical protein [Oribacterium sp.]